LNGVDLSKSEVSNAITVEGTNVSSPISIVGGTYSINGGPFTGTPGYVSPGAHVVVSVESSASYLTATLAQLTIGGVAATFTVTTRAMTPGAVSFGSATYTASGSATSAPVTITRTGGTDGPVTFDIVDASGAVVGHGTFAAGVGGVQTIAIPLSNDAGGAVLPLRITDITGGATPGAIATATLTVTAAPLAGVVVRSGGMGAVSPFMLLMLGLVTVMRFARRRGCWMLAAASLALVQVRGSQAADSDTWWSNLSAGARLGVSTSSLTNTEVSDQLAGAGFNVAADVSRSATAKTLLIDYALPQNFGVDFAWGYLGNTRIALSGTTPVDLNALLNDAAYDARGSGSDVSLSLRYRWILPSAWSVEARGGGYRWRTDTRVWLGPVLALERVDRGIGYTLGLGPRYQVTRAVGVSVNFDYFYSTTENRFWQETIGADYRF
jgi:OmpA-like transmembrane domain